jgi:peptidoglycan L-alanyl-D-glutamate endopeptidase CwlK
MPSRNIADLDPRLQPLCREFLSLCQSKGVDAFITQTYRSDIEQDAAYAQGRTAPGKIVTNARGGESPHNCVDVTGNPAARAFDFAIKLPEGNLDWDASDKAWQTALATGIQLGLISGTSFKTLKDNPHMEMADWKNVAPWDPKSVLSSPAA